MKAALRKGLVVTAGALLTISALSAAAGTTHYRWLDERGNPVYSDRPPPKGVDYEVTTTGTGLRRVVEAEEGAVPPKLQPTVGNKFKPENPKERAQASMKNPEYCERARKNLETLDSFARIRVQDENGEYRYIDEEEKAQRRKEAEDLIAAYCE